MRIVVTGAAGLIGTAVCAVLRASGDEVVALDRVAAPDGRDETWVRADLLSDALDEAIRGADGVVHLAAVPSPGGIPDSDLFANNAVGTFRVLDAAARVGVTRSVVASSVSIYGLVWAQRELSPARLPLSEIDDLHIEDAYALSKQADENTARMISNRSGMPTVGLRFPNVASEANIRARSRLVENDPIEAHRELWAYLELSDAGHAVRAALRSDTTGFVAVNAVSEQPLGDVDVAETARHFYPDADVSALRANCGYTTERARDLLGFVARRLL